MKIISRNWSACNVAKNAASVNTADLEAVIPWGPFSWSKMFLYSIFYAIAKVKIYVFII